MRYEQEAAGIAVIVQVGGHYTPFKVIQDHYCGTNQKPVQCICDFIFVNNTSLHPISHRLQTLRNADQIIAFNSRCL